MCSFSYCSSVCGGSAAVTNSCINHCHDNTCNIYCQIVPRPLQLSRKAEGIRMWVKQAHKPLPSKEGVASGGTGVWGKSASLPAFLPQARYQGLTCAVYRFEYPIGYSKVWLCNCLL